MYFKVVNGRIKNSRKPIDGGFEQNGLSYECDSSRLVVVSDTEVRDMTQEEIDALVPVNPLPALKLAYKNAVGDIIDPETKAAFDALTPLLKAVIGQMND